MLIHLVYEEEYVEQLKNILESAGHSVTEWDYSLTQFADFSERKQITAEIALVDGQAGVITKRDIIESLGKVRRNLPHLRLIVVFPESLEKDEAFISKLLTFSLYDMYFKDEYDIDDLEFWINTPKNYANYNVEIEDIRGSLKETDKSKIQGIENATKQISPTSSRQTNTLSFPKLPQLSLSNVDVKMPNLTSVKSLISSIPAIRFQKNIQDQSDLGLSWEDSGGVPAMDIQSLLGCVVWFWGSSLEKDVTRAASQYAKDLANSVPVLLLDGNLTNPGLGQEYNCPGPGWERSWIAKTPGVPPKKYYTKGRLTVWLLQNPVKVDDVDDLTEMWNVALFHIRSIKHVIVVDGGTFPPPKDVDINYPL